MAVMAKKRTGDRHKKRQMQIRLHEVLRAQLEKLADKKLSTVSAEITAAIRDHLTKEGFWPPGEK